MLSRVHDFSEVLWRIVDVDVTSDRANKDQLLTQMHEHLGSTLRDMTRATHEVLLDGPAEVSSAAERLRVTALRLQPLLKALIGDDGTERRRDYDRAYEEFRQDHVTFIGMARQALEVNSDSP